MRRKSYPLMTYSLIAATSIRKEVHSLVSIIIMFLEIYHYFGWGIMLFQKLPCWSKGYNIWGQLMHWLEVSYITNLILAFFVPSWCISKAIFDRERWKIVRIEMSPLLTTSWVAFLVVWIVLLQIARVEYFKDSKAKFIIILEVVDWETILSFLNHIVKTIFHLLEVATMII